MSVGSEKSEFKFKEFSIDWVRKPRARSISLQLRPSRTIRVVSPKMVPWTVIENFLTTKEAWMRKHLEKFEAIEALNPPKKLLADEKFLFLGNELKLRYLPTPLKSVFFSRTESELRLHLPELKFSELDQRELEIYLPLLKKFYRREAENFLKERIEIWSHEMALEFQKLSFRNQKTRWGSCTSRGHISLNWKLISTPLFVIDSVLIHELAHLVQMNHSSKFWALVENFCPDHARADLWLKQHLGAMEWLSV